jgi:hypothetical protein
MGVAPSFLPLLTRLHAYYFSGGLNGVIATPPPVEHVVES